MTKSLEKVIEQAEKLPPELQEELAEQFLDDTIVWFWIGSHSEYDHLLKRL